MFPLASGTLFTHEMKCWQLFTTQNVVTSHKTWILGPHTHNKVCAEFIKPCFYCTNFQFHLLISIIIVALLYSCNESITEVQTLYTLCLSDIRQQIFNVIMFVNCWLVNDNSYIVPKWIYLGWYQLSYS
jgi:hypothetical protein